MKSCLDNAGIVPFPIRRSRPPTGSTPNEVPIVISESHFARVAVARCAVQRLGVRTVLHRLQSDAQSH